MLRTALRLAFLVHAASAPALIPAPASAQDASELLVRINRLEGQVRQLSGSIEELQFQNKRLEEQLKKFQEDVEFRFQERSGGGKVGGAPAPLPPAAATARPGKRSDAFDPSAQPEAPGAPRVLGSAEGEPDPPRARTGQGERDIADLIDGGPNGGPLDLSTMKNGATPPSSPAVVIPPRQGAPSASQVAVAGTGSPRDQYDLAYGLVLQRQYEPAEMAFRQFLQSYPRDKLVPNATYWLGETYFRRSRYPDAVEQYLKIYKTYGTSKVAPDSMLRLAMSLRGMGQPEQACATLGEIGRKYPDASAEVKTSVEREQKRGNC